MASKYIDLYTGPGGYYNQYGGLVGSPTIGMQQGTYREGETQRVVHDTLNDKYYGTQSLDSLLKGLEDSIARSEAARKAGGRSVVSNAGTIFQREEYKRYSANELKDLDKQIKNQQKYITDLNTKYKKEANTFFDSYDAHTQGWDNVFTRRYNNEQQRVKNDKTRAQNEITEAKNKKIRARNEKIGKMNLRNEKISKTNEELKQNQGVTGNKLSYTVPSNNNLEINTGMATEKTKNRSGSNQVLQKNGLNI